MFESVTVAFTGIPEFGLLVTQLTPFDIIFLLNDLYIKLDDLLALYDVYKVETINDTYMVREAQFVKLKNV